MAYHEQHERKCPTCGERISATAPKCFNCGEYVEDEEDDGEEEAGKPRAAWGLVSGLVVALLGVGLLVYLGCVRRSNPEADAAAKAQKLHEMMGRQAGRPSLNSSSPLSWAEVKPRLRAGMPWQDLMRIVAEKNNGPSASTLVGNVPLPRQEEDKDEDKPRPQAYIIYLKDANLVVQTDEKENVVSWKDEPTK
jgi:hypothetical protein